MNLADSVRPGDNLDCLADDFSFSAKLIVTHVTGRQVSVRLLYRAELDHVNPHLKEVAGSPFIVEQRHGKKWCLIERETGHIIIDNLATQAVAYKALEDHMKALNS